VFNIARSVAALAATRRMPTMLWGGQGDAGALLSYGTDFVATYPSVAVFVDKVLKGAKPAETPFEVVSRRELAINLKVARELGLTIPGELLKRAGRVIE
jgi:putative ABC transport system substrate-binding protein